MKEGDNSMDDLSKSLAEYLNSGILDPKTEFPVDFLSRSSTRGEPFINLNMLRRYNFNPRMGKRTLYHPFNLTADFKKPLTCNLSLEEILKRESSFVPRVGKRILSFTPRIGKKEYNFVPRVGKRVLSFTPRIGKRDNTFTPRIGKRTVSSETGQPSTSGHNKKSFSFVPRVGKRKFMFVSRLGKRELYPGK